MASVKFNVTTVDEFLGIPCVLLVPLSLTTLGYLIHHIVKHKISVKFYIRLILALILMFLIYLLQWIGVHFYFGAESSKFTDFMASFMYRISKLRPLPTMLYTWQFYEVVYAIWDPKDRFFWLRNLFLTALIIVILVSYYLYCLWNGLEIFNMYDREWALMNHYVLLQDRMQDILPYLLLGICLISTI
jgi:hypothetical protein